MYEDEVPKEWFCPIGQELLKNPVIASDGFTYERKEIQDWFKRSDMSPITGIRLKNRDLIPNIALKNTIEQYFEKHDKKSIKPLKPIVNENSGLIKCQIDSVIQNESYYVDCKFIPPQSPEGGRMPCSILCILDVSQSMDQDAVLGGKDVESHGFSRLDLVKHSITTMTEFMGDGDEICLILFNNSAKVCLPLTKTNKIGKKIILQRLNQIEAKGSTNIWDGLKVSIDTIKPILKKEQNRNTFIVLLTDGQPNLNPPRGIIPTFKKYLMIEQMPTPNIHVFGYGYELDTNLLMDIAQTGNGTYTYIPDCSMVGTAFVNFMANSLACLTNKFRVRLQLSQGIQPPQIVGHGRNHGNLYQMGVIQYGQNRNLLLKFKERVAMGGVETLGKVHIVYGNRMEQVSFDIPVKHLPNSKQYIETINLRIKYLELLYQLVTQKLGLKENYNLIDQFYQFLKSKEENQIIRQLIKQIRNDKSQNQGQVSKAYEKEQWFTKWGKHYIPSLFLAHLMQSCTNFKDPALQLYGGPLFEKNRNQMDTIFIKMPPPQPTAKKQKNIVYKPAPQNMVDYYDFYGGCISEGCLVLMFDNSKKPIQDLKRGDKIKLKNGKAGVIECIVRSKVFGNVQMVRIGSLLITPWHPIKINNKWEFPANVFKKETVFVQSYYNYVLSEGKSMICEGVECIGLGHGIKDEVAFHEYLGSQLVVQNLKQSRNWKSGLVTVGKFQRDSITHKIVKIVPQQ